MPSADDCFRSVGASCPTGKGKTSLRAPPIAGRVPRGSCHGLPGGGPSVESSLFCRIRARQERQCEAQSAGNIGNIAKDCNEAVALLASSRRAIATRPVAALRPLAIFPILPAGRALPRTAWLSLMRQNRLDSTLAARGKSPATFDRRFIPAGCVARRSNIPDILPPRALPAGRLVGLGARATIATDC